MVRFQGQAFVIQNPLFRTNGDFFMVVSNVERHAGHVHDHLHDV